MKIRKIIAHEILDSRGDPTIEVTVLLEDGSKGVASVPAGASAGSHEAVELRDGDMTRYGGKGVLKAVSCVNEVIAPDLERLTALDQKVIDDRLIALDGTANKSHLGANAILATSVAVFKAAAKSSSLVLFRHLNPDAHLLPVPLMNVLNGGKHSPGSIDFQEVMIVPHGFESFFRALQAGSEIYHALRSILIDKSMSVALGDEGGFSVPGLKNEEALDLLVEAVGKAGYKTSTEVSLALDCAATSYFAKNTYAINQKQLSGSEYNEYMRKIADKYPIVSIEDPYAEDDWESFTKFTFGVGDKIQVVGDDLFVTNKLRLQKGIDQKCANAIIVKPNQIGTVTETLETIALAKKSHFAAVVSHRSGETLDSFIADLAVGCEVGQIKCGAPARGERLAKYNRLLEIERILGKRARFAQIF